MLMLPSFKPKGTEYKSLYYGIRLMQDPHSNTEHTEAYLNDGVILQLLPESILIFPFILYFFEKAPATAALI